jgi:hypothetical protein
VACYSSHRDPPSRWAGTWQAWTISLWKPKGYLAERQHFLGTSDFTSLRQAGNVEPREKDVAF